MKVLFCDFLRWTFPKANNPLKKTLEELGVECKFVQPCEIGHSNRALMIPMPEKHGASEHRGFDIDSMIKVGVARESGWYTPNIKL